MFKFKPKFKIDDKVYYTYLSWLYALRTEHVIEATVVGVHCNRFFTRAVYKLLGGDLPKVEYMINYDRDPLEYALVSESSLRGV